MPITSMGWGIPLGLTGGGVGPIPCGTYPASTTFPSPSLFPNMSCMGLYPSSTTFPSSSTYPGS